MTEQQRNQQSDMYSVATSEEVRLNKFLAERLGISRREADEAIAAGKVTINGEPAVLGSRVRVPSAGGEAWGTPTETCDVGENAPTGPAEHPTHVKLDKIDKVCYNGKIVPFSTEYTYLALNKPVGYLCSRKSQGGTPTIYELLPKKYQNLKTVGRLDKDSSGLILLTNDGDFAYQHTHPKFAKEKIYEVVLNEPLQPLHQQMISDYGISLEDGVSRFTVIRDTSSSAGGEAWGTPTGTCDVGENAPTGPAERYIVILREGRNRQIRRTFAALGYNVVKLHRTQFGKYELNNLKPGEYAIIKV